MHQLLWIEEVHMEIDIRLYDLDDVKMKWMEGNRFEIKVPGLAEKRPSVMRGDAVLVMQSYPLIH